MEADWEVEIGAETPVIDVEWSGRSDLRRNPQGAFELPEADGFPELAEALIRLNTSGTGWATSKCDVWQPDAYDGDEMDAPEDANFAMACYIDLVPENADAWPDPEAAVGWCREVCGQLKTVPLRGSRADLVVRRAVRSGDKSGFETAVGVTMYLTACGPGAMDALRTLGRCAKVVTDAVLAFAPAKKTAQKLQ